MILPILSAGVMAQRADPSIQKPHSELPVRLWRDPGDIASLDLINGIGGQAHAPDPKGTFRFVKDATVGLNPKFDVADAQGVQWKVKLGDESRPETAATRFLWAAGYLVDEDYFAAEITVAGLPALKHGGNYVSAGGVVHGARLERGRPPLSKVSDWDWFQNPFTGQRELNGLRVMMALLNSWDLKTMNNAVYEVNGERQYAVSDLGGTFGKTGDALMRTKGNARDYAASKFISNVRVDAIDFVLHSRPQFLGVFDVVNYRERTRMEQIARNIPRADVQWLAHRLSQLSDQQIHDVFRASGFGPSDVESLARTLRSRITALGGL
jgi:hypothetical protein